MSTQHFRPPQHQRAPYATRPGGQGNTLDIHTPPSLTQSTGC